MTKNQNAEVSARPVTEQKVTEQTTRSCRCGPVEAQLESHETKLRAIVKSLAMLAANEDKRGKG